MTGHEPAFPQSIATSLDGTMYCAVEKHVDFGGIPIRAYLASKAMQGLISRSYAKDFDNETMASLLAERSVEYADALIAELNKEGK